MIDGMIRTFTGRAFRPFEPRVEDVCIEDIAHALANMCRFNGHCREFYSVAQHSVHVSDWVAAPYKLAALLHDAAEAYMPDFCSPIKKYIRVAFPNFRIADISVIENCLLDRIARALGVPNLWPVPWQVEEIDTRLCATEQRALTYPALAGENRSEPLAMEVTPLLPARAEMLFLDRFEELRAAEK